MAKRKGKKDFRRGRPKPRRGGSLGFGIVITCVVLLGVGGIIASRGSDDGEKAGPAIGDHWHAALGVNVCGEWKPNTPGYESPKGIHSHGDGLIHMHPNSSAGAHERATVGLYLSQAGDEVDKKSIKLADGTDVSDGDECPNLDNKPAGVRWAVNGKEKARGTDPSKYVPNNGDVVAVAFLPQGTDIGVPPQASAVPSDVPGAQVPDTTPTTTAPTTPPSTGPETTPTTG